MIQFIDKVETPKIFFTLKAKQKIHAIAQYNESQECALEGIVRHEGNEYIIEDVFAYPQIITSATVSMDDDKYIQWLNDLPDDIINRKRFQVHSHVNMGVTPSGTDLNCYENYLSVVDDFMIFMIVNRKNEFNIWLYDMEQGLKYDKESLEISVLLDDDTSDYDWYCETMKAYLSTPAVKPKQESTNSLYKGGYGYDYSQYFRSYK